MSIKLYLGSSSTEKYLNKKSKKGYELECIIPFALFVPIKIDIYRFKKTTNKNRIYKIDSRNIAEEDLNDYIQLFKDDGWQIFKPNYSTGYLNNDYIFYSDDPNKKEIFSDKESIKNRNRENALYSLMQGMLLVFGYLIIISLFNLPFQRENLTFWDYILQNAHVIGVIIIIAFSFIKYLKNRVSDPN